MNRDQSASLADAGSSNVWDAQQHAICTAARSEATWLGGQSSAEAGTGRQVCQSKVEMSFG